MKFTSDELIAIGRRCKQARVDRGFTNAAEFARWIEVDPFSLARIEQGQSEPRGANIVAIAKLTNTTTDYLLRGEEASGAPEAFRAWLVSSARAKAAPAESIAFVGAIPVRGYTVNPRFFDLLLTAYERGLSPDEAARAAKTTQLALDE